jgi:hydrogenase/urease accessory protein HupE
VEPNDIIALVKTPELGIVPALMFVGYILKTLEKIPNNYIPAILAVLGLFCGWVFIQNTPTGALVGLLLAAVAIGFHSGFKNSQPRQ